MILIIIPHSEEVATNRSDVVWLRGMGQGIILREQYPLLCKIDKRICGRRDIEVGIFEPDLQGITLRL